MSGGVGDAVEGFSHSFARTEQEERELQAWATGWDAAVAWLWPLLERANADADRYYRAAFAPTPKPKFGPTHAERRRATAELQEQRAREHQETRR